MFVALETGVHSAVATTHVWSTISCTGESLHAPNFWQSGGCSEAKFTQTQVGCRTRRPSSPTHNQEYRPSANRFLVRFSERSSSDFGRYDIYSICGVYLHFRKYCKTVPAEIWPGPFRKLYRNSVYRRFFFICDAQQWDTYASLGLVGHELWTHRGNEANTGWSLKPARISKNQLFSNLMTFIT